MRLDFEGQLEDIHSKWKQEVMDLNEFHLKKQDEITSRAQDRTCPDSKENIDHLISKISFLSTEIKKFKQDKSELKQENENLKVEV